MKYLSISLIISILLACGSNQQEENEQQKIIDQMSELIDNLEVDKEKEEEYREPDYEVQVFDDAKEVREFQGHIDLLNEKLIADSENNKRIGRRYVTGEFELRDEIVELLKDVDSDEKTQLFID